jgi:hypothetical protein
MAAGQNIGLICNKAEKFRVGNFLNKSHFIYLFEKKT